MVIYYTTTSVASPTCRYEELSINDTIFKWPETNGGSSASFMCPNNPSFTVNRQCIPGGQWGTFDEAGCGVLTQVFRDISARSQNVYNKLQLIILHKKFYLLSDHK